MRVVRFQRGAKYYICPYISPDPIPGQEGGLFR